MKENFGSHFIKKRNIIYERARFNLRHQEEGEPVEVFVTSLSGLAEYCQFGALHDDLIRDRIVVGIRDARLSENLQLDHQLTLEKAVTSVRQSELIKEQQKTLRSKALIDATSEHEREVGAVNKTKRKQPTQYTRTTHTKTNPAEVKRGCGSK